MSDCRFGVSPVNYPDPEEKKVVPNSENPKVVNREIIGFDFTEREISRPNSSKSIKEMRVKLSS